jgi:hypothetical protein
MRVPFGNLNIHGNFVHVVHCYLTQFDDLVMVVTDDASEDIPSRNRSEPFGSSGF